MPRFSSIHAAFLMTLFATSATYNASTQATKPISGRRTFIDKLNQFVSSVGRGFQSVALSMKALRNIHRADAINAGILENVNSYVRDLKSLEPACRDGWVKYGASCFMFLQCPKGCSVNEARKSCVMIQADLAKILSAKHEQFFIRSLNTSVNIMFGGNSREGTWRWPDGSLMTDGYENWYPDEPNDRGSNCMWMYVGMKKWYDVPCDHTYVAGHKIGYVCESSPTFY